MVNSVKRLIRSYAPSVCLIHLAGGVPRAGLRAALALCRAHFRTVSPCWTIRAIQYSRWKELDQNSWCMRWERASLWPPAGGTRQNFLLCLDRDETGKYLQEILAGRIPQS